MKLFQFVILSLFSLFLMVSLSHPVWASPDSAYVVCQGENEKNQLRTEWALTQPGLFFQIHGKKSKLPAGNVIFLSHTASRSEIEKVCEQTFEIIAHQKGRRNDFKLLSFWAKYNSLSPELEIRFTAKKEKDAIRDSHLSLNQICNDFLEILKGQMTSKNYKNLLTSSVQNFFEDFPESKRQFSSVIDKVNRFSEQPFLWNSEEPTERLSQWINSFGDQSDFDLLSYQLRGPRGGIMRGSMNSFVDFAVDLYMPTPPEGPSHRSESLSLFRPGDPNHERTSAMIRTFTAFAALKGYLDCIPNWIQKDSDSDSEMLQELHQKYTAVLNSTLESIDQLIPWIDERETRASLMDLRSQLADVTDWNILI